MVGIKHAMFLGDELAEMIDQYLDGEIDAIKSMALEQAIHRLIPDAKQRIHFAEGILESAAWQQQGEMWMPEVDLG